MSGWVPLILTVSLVIFLFIIVSIATSYSIRRHESVQKEVIRAIRAREKYIDILDHVYGQEEFDDEEVIYLLPCKSRNGSNGFFVRAVEGKSRDKVNYFLGLGKEHWIPISRGLYEEFRRESAKNFYLFIDGRMDSREKEMQDLWENGSTKLPGESPELSQEETSDGSTQQEI